MMMTDFYELDCQGIDTTSPTGRINKSCPRIVSIDTRSGARNVISLLVDVDYSELEKRVLSHYQEETIQVVKAREVMAKAEKEAQKPIPFYLKEKHNHKIRRKR